MSPPHEALQRPARRPASPTDKDEPVAELSEPRHNALTASQARQTDGPSIRASAHETRRSFRVSSNLPVRRPNGEDRAVTGDRPLALGCMRLSTERDRDESGAIALLHAALDAGVTLLDTADAYCWDDDERGHNERLIARAVGTWQGDRSMIVVATKGGMTRPGGRWVPDGRAKHLAAACEGSCRALGVERIDLYQLHTPDPRVSVATSVRALATLKRDGLIDRVGLCNVTVGQIEEARRIVEIDSIQVELSLWHDQHFLSGVVRYCIANRLRLLAYRPLGGTKSRSRIEKNPVLGAIAARHEATPFDVALAWLAGLAEVIVPIPGATRVDTARSIARHRTLQLTGEEIAGLDELCPAARLLRDERIAHVKPSARQDAEIVMVMGLPGAGKSTMALTARGYLRLNRDAAGGTLRSLVQALDRALDAGASRVILDNTYVSRASRAAVIQAAAAHGVPVRCVWLSTSIADAQVNAVGRLVERYGKLLDIDELTAHSKRDPAALAPTTLFRYQRELEPPDVSEGFARVDVVPFERRVDPSRVNRAIIIWCDGILVRSRSNQRVPTSIDDVVVDTGRAATLRRYAEQGFRLLGLSWQPEIADGKRTRAEAEAVFARMNELLGLAIEVEYCPHVAGPPQCWCRKPLPGLGVLLIHRHHLDPAACIYVGDGSQDAGYARRLGFQYRPAREFSDNDSG
jgi:aryl-alcohol dehydrogenase-like predicted oxidoreductase/histidinol phosphatase-like enzyme/predicted kinase